MLPLSPRATFSSRNFIKHQDCYFLKGKKKNKCFLLIPKPICSLTRTLKNLQLQFQFQFHITNSLNNIKLFLASDTHTHTHKNLSSMVINLISREWSIFFLIYDPPLMVRRWRWSLKPNQRMGLLPGGRDRIACTCGAPWRSARSRISWRFFPL